MPHTLQSGNTYASVSPAAPPAPPVSTNQTWEWDVIPRVLGSKQISEFNVDFLDKGEADHLLSLADGLPPRKNHVLIRLLFKHQVSPLGSSYAPGNATGVMLDMNPEWSTWDITAEGRFCVKTMTFTRPHQRALHSMAIKVAPGKTVGGFLATIKESGMLPFKFRFNGLGWVGCKDWGSQTIENLKVAGILQISSTEEVAVNQNFHFDMEKDSLSQIPWNVACFRLVVDALAAYVASIDLTEEEIRGIRHRLTHTTTRVDDIIDAVTDDNITRVADALSLRDALRRVHPIAEALPSNMKDKALVVIDAIKQVNTDAARPPQERTPFHSSGTTCAAVPTKRRHRILPEPQQKRRRTLDGAYDADTEDEDIWEE
ncbi:uncharacterized protein N7459_009922 [Penicillium hispanicum]|uniref:uncharacterized protein n=1 Tax=Penicillium hispanicum TaxID=1080232 RepID=UPI0025405C79|nr:uncharacterized protein N7459_009922 [Penicillium hispanicum]KAJ5570492.1 hypothetical protein N7459_009922 [Penicillium hispanicum]